MVHRCNDSPEPLATVPSLLLLGALLGQHVQSQLVGGGQVFQEAVLGVQLVKGRLRLPRRGRLVHGAR